MLTRLHVRGYKALRDIDTSLEPLTVIVGPNGCGKTSVLESIALVRDFFSLSPGEALELHPLEELKSKNEALLGVEVDLWARFDGDEEITGDLKIFLSHHGEHHGVGVGSRVSEELIRKPSEATSVQNEAARKVLLSIRKLALNVESLARPSYLQEIAPRIEDDGSGLATVLSTLIGEQREKFEEIQRQLRDLVPELDRILIRPAPIPVVQSQEVPVGIDKEGKEVLATRHYQRNVIGHEIVFDYRHAKGIRAKHASEGTLLLLGLLTVAITEDVRLLLLDDVDRALHPKAQQQLVEYLRRISRDGVQTIATTHSPYVVLHLEYEEVRAMMMSDSGGALIGKLTDHPEYERWREDMTPSEFWTVFGEEWLARAKAKAEDHG
jgi:ABC-type cobalamin/Fe3+-siderophores transport system ATPase subunit